MLLELAIVTYILTYTVTMSKLFEGAPIKRFEVFNCYFCFSLWVSLALAVLFNYVRLDSGYHYLNIPLNALIVMFVANVIYWLFEIMKRLAKYLETADYERYQRIEKGKEGQ